MIYRAIQLIQIFLADGRTDGRTKVIQEVLADLKILNQAQIHLCLCVSLFWCCNTLIFWRVCSSETPDCRHSWKANNVTCVRIFLLLPVNSMSVVVAYDVELRPYVHTHSKGIIYVFLLEITPIFSCPSLCHVGLLRNGQMLQSYM